MITFLGGCVSTGSKSTVHADEAGTNKKKGFAGVALKAASKKQQEEEERKAREMAQREVERKALLEGRQKGYSGLTEGSARFLLPTNLHSLCVLRV